MFADMDFWFPDLPEHDDQGDDQNNVEDPNRTGTSRYSECRDQHWSMFVPVHKNDQKPTCI
jgi:hypothetical protein